MAKKNVIALLGDKGIGKSSFVSALGLEDFETEGCLFIAISDLNFEIIEKSQKLDILLCFDMSDSNSFLNVKQKWKPRVDDYISSNPADCNFYLLGLNSDVKREVQLQDIGRYAGSIGATEYFECSSKDPKSCTQVVKTVQEYVSAKRSGSISVPTPEITKNLDSSKDLIEADTEELQTESDPPITQVQELGTSNVVSAAKVADNSLSPPPQQAEKEPQVAIEELDTLKYVIEVDAEKAGAIKGDFRPTNTAELPTAPKEAPFLKSDFSEIIEMAQGKLDFYLDTVEKPVVPEKSEKPVVPEKSEKPLEDLVINPSLVSTTPLHNPYLLPQIPDTSILPSVPQNSFSLEEEFANFDFSKPLNESMVKTPEIPLKKPLPVSPTEKKSSVWEFLFAKKGKRNSHYSQSQSENTLPYQNSRESAPNLPPKRRGFFSRLFG